MENFNFLKNNSAAADKILNIFRGIGSNRVVLNGVIQNCDLEVLLDRLKIGRGKLIELLCTDERYHSLATYRQ